MDMSFANQVLAIEYLLKQGSALKPDVYPVPPTSTRSSPG